MYARGVVIPYARSGLLCVVFLLLCCCAESRAAVFHATARMPELLSQAGCYAETGASAGGFQQISSQDFSRRFSSCRSLERFEANTVYWLRFPADLLPAGAVLGLQNAASGSLTLFLPGKPGTNYVTIMSSETDAPVSPHFPFPAMRLPDTLSLAPNNTDARSFAYLQIHAAQAPTAALRLFSAEAFARLTWHHVLALGLALGALVAALGFALCCWLAQRSKLHFLYLAFLAALFCYHLAASGILGLLNPLLATIATAWPTTLGYGVLICSAAYSRFFLETKHHAPLTDLLIRLCPFLLLAGLACLVFDAGLSARVIGFTTALLLLGLYFAGTLKALRAKLPGTRLYLSAWAALLTGVLFAFANNLLGFSHSFFSSHFLLFASSLAGLPLSLALVKRSPLAPQEQRRSFQEYDRQAVEITDELTGLYNKRFFESSLENAIESSKLTGSPLSLLLLNVDNFRRFNEAYGPPQADKVLSILGELIRKSVRAQDVPCRFDKEEFAIILPGATENDAMHAAERFRKAFSNLFFHPDPGIRVNSTLNIGVVTCATDDTANSVFERAGQALYQAKLDSQQRIASADQN